MTAREERLESLLRRQVGLCLHCMGGGYRHRFVIDDEGREVFVGPVLCILCGEARELLGMIPDELQRVERGELAEAAK